MNRIFTLLFISLFFYGTLAGQAPFNATADEMVRMDVAYLSSDLLKGRLTGTEDEIAAANYIASRMQALGLKPGGVDGTYFHRFEFEYKANPHSSEGGEKKQGLNVIGVMDNGAPYSIIMGAHFDHLGMGGPGSLHTGAPDIHNGADDNASGVAAILLLADRVRGSELEKKFNFVFIGFSGEELGLYGSKNWANDPTYPMDRVTCMLNYDMVGRLNEERVLMINGVGTSPEWKSLIEKVSGDLTIKTTESGVGASDHTSFYLKNIPAVHFFTGQHQDYHKPADDAHLINYDGIEAVADMTLRMLGEMPSDKKIAFTKTADAPDSRERARFKVTLGVMPDYVFTGEGMRIDGVIDGRAAAAAGMESGDIIIRIGEHEVKDIYGYMAALGQFKAGDKTSVVFIRKDQTITKEVVF